MNQVCQQGIVPACRDSIIVLDPFCWSFQGAQVKLWIKYNLFVCMRVSWKVHRLTKIPSWNVTKWGLFFNIVTFTVHSLLQLVLQCLDPIGNKIHQHYHMNFSAQFVFTQPLYFKQGVTQGQFLSRVKLVWIQNFPSSRLVALPTLKSSVYNTIYS